MNVQGALRCDVEDRWRQEYAVGDDHDDIRACRAYAFCSFRGLQGFGLEDVQAMQAGEVLDRTRRRLLTAPSRTIGLREHERDLVSGTVQRGEGSLRKVRRAGED
jgi:hypothetical protein